MVKLKSLAIDTAKELQPPPSPGDPYSVPIPGTKREGRTEIYRHWRFKDSLLETLDPAIRTAHDFFESTANTVPKNRCLGHRPWDPASKTFGPYVWQDYQTVQKRRRDFGMGLVNLHERVGVRGSQYGVGLWCQNRPEWQISDLACMSQNLFTVSLYDTLGPDTTEYIINHAELTCVVTSLMHIPTLLKIKPRCPSLKLIISLDPMYEGEMPKMSKAELLQQFAEDFGVQIFYVRDVEEIGQKHPRPYNPPNPEDIITINYTSGTTGDPKGVVLTHRNAVAAASSSLCLMKQTNDDVGCSFLPLAHIYQRVCEHMGLWAGGAIGYFHGNVNEIVEDIKLLRPTAFSGVPRLYNRMGAGIRTKALEAPRLRGALSRHVVKVKLEAINNPDPRKATNKHAFWDKIWARKVSGQVGLDRCHTIVSGSAPLDPSLHQFLRVCFATTFAQGYGLTESYASSLCQLEGDMSVGNCGACAPSGEMCLRDVPDMEYLTTDKPYPRGELLLRGNTIFREYWKNEAETKKAKDEEGWFATGDIAMVDDMGRFYIIDRVKNLLKLSHGEYVSPERIENVYLANAGWLASAYIHGDSDKSALVGIFGVEPEHFAPFAAKILGKNITMFDIPAMQKACQDEKVLAAAQKELDRISKESKFAGFERCRALYLFIEPFTEENNLITPTMKLKRVHVGRWYRKHIDELYAQVAAEDAKKPVRSLL